MKALAKRIEETVTFYRKLGSLGIPDHMLGEFRQVCNDFVKYGTSASGAVKLRGAHRILVYKLSTQEHVESTIVLKHSADV